MFALDASTAVDVGLWIILAAAFALVVFGCYITRSSPKTAAKTAVKTPVKDTLPIELDHAA